MRKVHGGVDLTVLRIMAVLSVCFTAMLTSSRAGDGKNANTPLIARGYTDAPEGIALVAGDPEGGSNVIELRIREGQKVTRDEIISVLSNYAKANAALRIAEGQLTRLKRIDDEVLKAIGPAQIALQEAAVQSAEADNKLKALERARSNKPLDQRELEARIADLSLQKQRSDLKLAKQSLANDQARNQADILKIEALIRHEYQVREQALVRSPLNGVVVQIFSRVGERVSPNGIAKIVDMGQLRAIADVDELNLNRVKLGEKVEITFRGNAKVYKGTITRIGEAVKRMQRADPYDGSSTDARTVQVQIGFDDPENVPQVLGREARVVFP
jgi:multidrug resistance efflux pump